MSPCRLCSCALVVMILNDGVSLNNDLQLRALNTALCSRTNTSFLCILWKCLMDYFWFWSSDGEKKTDIEPVISLIQIEYVLVGLMIVYNIKMEHGVQLWMICFTLALHICAYWHSFQDAAFKWLINTSDSWPWNSKKKKRKIFRISLNWILWGK